MNALRDRHEVTQKNDKLFEIRVTKDELMQTIAFLRADTDFMTLSQIACTDWIEDEIFLLNYIFTSKNRDKNLMIKVTISRDGESMPSIHADSPQAEVMERDLHEMYGIVFDGNDTLYDFSLEDWKGIPPLRRDFDTLEFVNANFDFKGGRDDNKDVKVELKRRREEAKKQKALEAALEVKTEVDNDGQ
ncbi:MAG TPA: NADH-quinone oxidoreductase subunit C [Sulfurovum sp.]|nr:NADH-quinone oxidoreductase subunit C [Sulfurovum sp.]